MRRQQGCHQRGRAANGTEYNRVDVTARKNPPMTPAKCSLGFSTHLGWAAVAAIRRRGDKVSAVRTYRMETAEPANRAVLEPYHVAGGFEGLRRTPPPANPEAVVAKGLEAQQRHTLEKLAGLLQLLDDWHPGTAVIFTGRGRLSSTLQKVLASHAQIHVAEGLAVRKAVAMACSRLGLTVVEQDKRDLSAELTSRFGVSESDALQDLQRIRPDNQGPWRKEEKLCALAALLA